MRGLYCKIAPWTAVVFAGLFAYDHLLDARYFARKHKRGLGILGVSSVCIGGLMGAVVGICMPFSAPLAWFAYKKSFWTSSLNKD